jgi:hypothetical protein
MALTSSTDLGTLLTLDGIAATGGPEVEMGFQRAQQNHWEAGTSESRKYQWAGYLSVAHQVEGSPRSLSMSGQPSCMITVIATVNINEMQQAVGIMVQSEVTAISKRQGLVRALCRIQVCQMGNYMMGTGPEGQVQGRAKALGRL